MPLKIGQPVDHGFDQPLGLLSDCHRRIEHFLRVLSAVAAEAGGGPLSPSSREALAAALRYFAVAAPKHTADEERSLFPRLRACGDPAAAAALTVLDGLEQDHHEADAHHAAVDALVRQWLDADRLPAADAERLGGHLARLQALYQRHIAIEDRDIFPAAARVLDRSQIVAIGLEMAARRQVRPQTDA